MPKHVGVRSAIRQRWQANAGGCPYRLCHPNIVVMQAAEDRDRSDSTDGLNGPAYRCVLAQCEMRANAITIGGLSGQDSAQMCLTEYDDMVEAFPSDRTDRPL